MSDRLDSFSSGDARPRIHFIDIQELGTSLKKTQETKKSFTSVANTTIKGRAIDVTDYAISCSWTSALEPPYETASLELKAVPEFGTELPRQAYLRVVIPNNSPVDPGRVLWFGMMSSVTEFNQSSESGLQEQRLSMEFIGFYDVARESDVLAVARGKGSGKSSFATVLDHTYVRQISSAGAISTLPGRELGPFLQTLWNGKNAVYQEGDSETVEKEAVRGIARIGWPKMYSAGSLGEVGGNNFQEMCDWIPVIYKRGVGSGRASWHVQANTKHNGQFLTNAEKNHTGLITSKVPGVAPTKDAAALYSLHKGGSKLGSIIEGTFKCDASLVEIFPTITYDPKNRTSQPVLMYRMKPFRTQTGGEFIEFQNKLSESQIAKRFLRVGHSERSRALDRVLDLLIKRADFHSELTAKYTNVLRRIFGPPTWPRAKNLAVDIERDYTFSVSRQYTLQKQINAITASAHSPTPSSTLHIESELPIVSKHRVHLEGVRLHDAQWKYLMYNKDEREKDVAAKDPRTGRHTVRSATMGQQLIALALESVQSLMNAGDYGHGTVDCTFNPDIRPGRALRFRGFQETGESAEENMRNPEIGPGTSIHVSKERFKVLQSELEGPVSSKTNPEEVSKHIETNNRQSSDVESRRETTKRKKVSKGSQFAYCISVTHSYTSGSLGEVSLRTSFNYDMYAADESQREYKKKYSAPEKVDDGYRHSNRMEEMTESEIVSFDSGLRKENANLEERRDIVNGQTPKFMEERTLGDTLEEFNKKLF